MVLTSTCKSTNFWTTHEGWSGTSLWIQSPFLRLPIELMLSTHVAHLTWKRIPYSCQGVSCCSIPEDTIVSCCSDLVCGVTTWATVPMNDLIRPREACLDETLVVSGTRNMWHRQCDSRQYCLSSTSPRDHVLIPRVGFILGWESSSARPCIDHLPLGLIWPQ